MVPWGYVCGYPTKNGGDLYGGAHYSQSSSATLTLQGRAIRDASIRFGDGMTLPITVCKKGYVPWKRTTTMTKTTPDTDTTTTTTTTTTRDTKQQQPEKNCYMFRYACPLHDQARRSRIRKENGCFRVGEVNLHEVFGGPDDHNKNIMKTCVGRVGIPPSSEEAQNGTTTKSTRTTTTSESVSCSSTETHSSTVDHVVDRKDDDDDDEENPPKTKKRQRQHGSAHA